jgi:hypothetical protein
MTEEMREAIAYAWPKRHNLFIRTRLWNLINLERQRRMRYAGYRNGTWMPGSYPSRLAQ